MDSILSILSAIPDHRRPQGRRFALAPLILFTLLSMLANARSYRQMAEFMQTHLAQLNALANTHWKKAPSHVALRYILGALCVTSLTRLLAASAQPSTSPTALCQFIAIDGKTLRGSRRADQPAEQILSAFAHVERVILAQVPINEKSNEIPATQQLLASLGLQGIVYTMDAMHCQKNSENCA